MHSAHACRVCGGLDSETIFSHGDTPLFLGIVWPETPADLADKHLPIAMVRCRDCHAVQLPVEPALEEIVGRVYSETPRAGTSLVTGEGEFGRELALRFLEGVGMSKALPQRVLEIGCNQGHMLAMCKERGAQVLVGVEPSKDKEFSPAPGVTIIPGFFDSARLGGAKFDLAYMIEVLEHISSPTALLRDVRRALVPGGRIAISVPNCESGLEFGNIGMPIHEHLMYFTPGSLGSALRRAGFRVVHLKATFSHLYCLAENAGGEQPRDDGADVASERFWPACKERFAVATRFARAQTRPWGLYGACSLTTNLLAWSPEIDLDLCKVVDADPNKRGRVVSGCPGETLSPQDAVDAGISNVLVMPFGFQEGIGTYIRDRFPALKPTLLFEGMADRYAARQRRVA